MGGWVVVVMVEGEQQLQVISVAGDGAGYVAMVSIDRSRWP